MTTTPDAGAAAVPRPTVLPRGGAPPPPPPAGAAPRRTVAACGDRDLYLTLKVSVFAPDFSPNEFVAVTVST
jgi:hypothetical protein